MRKIIDITKEDCTKVQEKYYQYNSLLDIITILVEKNDVYEDILKKISNCKHELEQLKSETVRKYITDFDKVLSFEFDFYNNELKYEVNE